LHESLTAIGLNVSIFFWLLQLVYLVS